MSMLIGFGLLLSVSYARAGSLELRVIPNVSPPDKEVTLDIGLPRPGASVAIQLTAKRLDKNNDGILVDVSSTNLPIGPPILVKDLDTIVPYAKDRDPRAGHIQVQILPPPEPGEYVVTVTMLDADPAATARQLLVVYSRSVKATEPEVLPLADLPAATPKVLLSEVFLSLRSQASGSGEAATLWKVDNKLLSSQLTREGFSKTPRWGPSGKYSSWIAYSFAESRQEFADIWILDSSNPTRRQQVTRSALGDTSPIWSPDGSFIAFIRGDMLMTAAIDRTGNEERILERAGLDQLISWDPRSNSIVFVQKIPQSQALEIWSVNMATHRTKALTYTPLWELVRSVAGSHNHTRLLVEWRARTSDRVDIYAIDFPGQRSVNLTEFLKGCKCSQPALSNGGNEVAFIASDLH